MKRFLVLLALGLLAAVPAYAFAGAGGVQNQLQARCDAAPEGAATQAQLQSRTQLQTQSQTQQQDPEACENSYQYSFEYSNQPDMPDEAAQHQEQVRTENTGAESNVEVRSAAAHGSDEKSGETDEAAGGDSFGTKIRAFFGEVWATVTSFWRG